jgi:outer membrane lipopolysaccharide assembly protein LptE/RlpB
MRPFARLLLLLPLLLAGCGYHLAGSGEGSGAVPADVQTLSLQMQGADPAGLLPELKRSIGKAHTNYRLVGNDAVVASDTHARLFLQGVAEAFTPSAYDATGIAVQYRLTISATLQLYRHGEQIWNSGPIHVSGDVYVSGGPVSIEASRQQLRRDLRGEWVRIAMSRLRSGF